MNSKIHRKRIMINFPIIHFFLMIIVLHTMSLVTNEWFRGYEKRDGYKFNTRYTMFHVESETEKEYHKHIIIEKMRDKEYYVEMKIFLQNKSYDLEINDEIYNFLF